MSGFWAKDYSGSFLGSNHSVPWTPLTLGSCLLWVSAKKGITLGTTPLATGTSPPAITISGNLTQVVGLRIEITTSGVRGTAIFRWSIDGGNTYTSNVLTAATVLLGVTGITVTFPNSTYTNDNVYVGRIAAWSDRAKVATDQTQTTVSNQPTLTWSDLNSQPAVSFTNPRFLNSSVFSPAPCTIIAIAKCTVSGAGGYSAIAALGNSVGGAFIFGVANGVTQWGEYSNANVLSGQNISTYKKITAVIRNYNDIDLRTNGNSVTVSTGVSAYVSPSFIGAGVANGTQNLEGGICELLVFSRVLNTTECIIVENYLGNQYGI